jgi:AraC family transcriptional regulator
MDSPASPDIAEPRLERRKTMLLAGISERYTAKTRHRIPAQWQRFAGLAARLPGRIGRARYGVSTMTADGFEYLAGAEVTSIAELPAEFRALRIPPRLYAMFEHRGDASTIFATCDAIGRHWLPASGHTVAGPPELIERYGPEFDAERGIGGMEVWLPLEG